MSRDDTRFQSEPDATEPPSADALLAEHLRRGDSDAGRRFFYEQYPAVYRYLLWLTESPETAEDLAQETFIRAWRRLDTFDGRAPLGAWLHRIAHREFLRFLRSRRPQASLEEVAEVAEPRASELTDAVELRAVIRKLPVEQREVVVLHYLHGYECREIAGIVGATASTVKYRLSAARAHLQRELGEDDLGYLNEPSAPMRQWAWLPLERMRALETRLVTHVVGDPPAPGPGASPEEAMERREFLRQATAGTVGLMVSGVERDVVDGRLARKVTLAFKGIALSDVCDQLRAETGVHLAAGRSVADEKVTLFCRATPLREVMRQLSRPFGYAWTRSTANAQRSMLDAQHATPNRSEASIEHRALSTEYRYELEQDLRSQLLEEELRSRDRHAALLSLERETERCRPYLDLSPDEALERAQSAAPEEKRLLMQLAHYGWGPIQMYFRLSPQELATLRSGQELKFSSEPGPGEQLLPSDVTRGVLESMRYWRLFKREGVLHMEIVGPGEKGVPDGLPPVATPEVRARVSLWIRQNEPGLYALGGTSGLFAAGPSRGVLMYLANGLEPVAAGINTAVRQPDNRRTNAKLARDPALQRQVRIRVTTTGRPPPDYQPIIDATERDRWKIQVSPPTPKVTTADALEALHQATGMNLVADYYTRLYTPEDVSVQDVTLFEALCRLADTMDLRWLQDGDWLQFRSITYYEERLKEVPNRLLARWSASRQRHGALTLDDLIEIAQLADAQLDAEDMAEGARDYHGLVEWDLGSSPSWRLRPHLRYLASFTPAQRQKAMSETGLPFHEMTLPQQQQFIVFAFEHAEEPLRSLEELSGAAVRVVYTQPGAYEWRPTGRWRYRWAVPVGNGRSAFRPPALGHTPEEALQAARRTERRILEAMLDELRRLDPGFDAARIEPQEAQIVPTTLDLAVIYLPGSSASRNVYVRRASDDPPRVARSGKRALSQPIRRESIP